MQVHRPKILQLKQIKKNQKEEAEKTLNHEGLRAARAIYTGNKNTTKPSPVVLTGAKRKSGQLKWSKNPSHSLKRQKITVDFVCFVLWIIFPPSLGLREFFEIVRN